MLARRLIAARTRSKRPEDFAVEVSHILSTSYQPPLPGPDGSVPIPPYDGLLTFEPNGAPKWRVRDHERGHPYFAQVSATPPGSTTEGTIPLQLADGQFARFRSKPDGIDLEPLEYLPHGQTNAQWARHLCASVNTSNMANVILTAKNARTGQTETITASQARWINTGESFVSASNTLVAPTIAYASYGIGLTNLSGKATLELSVVTIPTPPEIICVRDIGDITSRTWAVYDAQFAEDDAVLRRSYTLQTGLSTNITLNTSRRRGRHYSTGTLVTVEIARSPLGPEVESGYRPCILKIRVRRRTGLLVLAPTGVFEFHTIRLEEYSPDIDAWLYGSHPSGRVGYVLPGNTRWPALPNDFPVTTTIAGTVPGALPIVMNDRVLSITSSRITAWAFDGTPLGFHTVPSGIGFPTRLDRTEILYTSSGRFSRDYGATWTTYPTGTWTLPTAHHSVCVY